MTQTRRITVANTGRDGEGAVAWFGPFNHDVQLIRLSGVSEGTTAAGLIRCFTWSYPERTKTLHEEKSASGTGAPSGTVAAGTVEFDRVPVKLPAGWQVGAAPHNAETWVFTAEFEP